MRFSYGGVWVVVKSADGTTYDTRVPLENAAAPGRGRAGYPRQARCAFP